MKRLLYGGILAGMAALIAACSSETTSPVMARSGKFVSTPRASTTTWIGNGTTDGGVCETFLEDANDLDPGPGQQGWLFILTSPGTGPHALTYNFDDGTTGTVPPFAEPGSIHFVVYTSAGAKLLSASAVEGTDNSNLTVSHCEVDGNITVQGSSVVTTVHSATHSEVSNASPAALGSTVHDKATVTLTGTIQTFPAGSTVTFYFWNNSGCTGAPAYTSAPIAVTGSSPGDVDDGLPQTLGAGEYAYRADFTSGAPTEVPSSEGACEPFKVDKGKLHLTTTVHDAAHANITSGNTPLGSKVHDVAAVTGAVSGFTAPTGVTFTFYTNATCDGAGTAVAADGADGAGTKSAESGALGAGSYSYMASLEGNDNYTVDDDTGCEPFTVDKGKLHVTTAVHNAAHTAITNGSVALGSSVHDLATVTGAVSGFAPENSVTFKFYTNGSCTNPGSNVATDGDEGTGTTKSAASGALGAGSYSYLASLAGDANYTVDDDTGCEPFTVNEADVTISTVPHNAAHVSILNGKIAVGQYVHDNASLSGAVSGFTITGTVTFNFFTNSTCTGTPASSGSVAVGSESSPIQILAVGSYAYSAKYNGDDPNYKASGNADCEPFSATPPGLTMGFWGNVNGQARLVSVDAFSAANAVTLGDVTKCGVVVNTAAKSLTILPNTLNGMSLISLCNAGNKLDNGINTGSFNTLLSQTLALSYNIKYVSGYMGLTIGGLACTAVSPLTSTSTVQDARNYANSLIADAIKGGTVVTQSQIGLMNTLLGCLNREQ